MAIDPPMIGLASGRLSCKLNIHRSLGPSRSVLALLADEDDPHTLARGDLAALAGANDHLVHRDLQDLAATLRGHGVPGFLAEAVVQQERKVELRRWPELLQGLQQRIALGRQAGHHVIPPGGVLGGGVLAPNEAGFFEVKDAASNSFQAGLEDGSFALAFGHCQLTPAFGDGIQDRVTRLHGGKSAEELAPDLCLSLGTVDVGACFATPSFGRTDAAVGSVAWSCGIGDPHHPKRAGFASGKPTKLVLAWTAAAGPVPDPTRIRAVANYSRPLNHSGEDLRAFGGCDDALTEADRIPVRTEDQPALVRPPPTERRVNQDHAYRLFAPAHAETSLGCAPPSKHVGSLGGAGRGNASIVEDLGDRLEGGAVEELIYDPACHGGFLGMLDESAVNDVEAVGALAGPLALQAAGLLPLLDP